MSASNLLLGNEDLWSGKTECSYRVDLPMYGEIESQASEELCGDAL